jgi:LysR family transcriptional regulator of beta-lactamase
MFDSSSVMIEAALLGAGVALAPVAMFERELREGRLVRPFDAEVVTGSYWLTRLKSKEPGPAMRAFEGWIFEQAS